MINKKVLILSIFFLLLPVFSLWPITLVRVGYIDIETIISTYTQKYLDTEITMREEYINQLNNTYNEKYFEMTDIEREEIRTKIRDQNEVLHVLRYNQNVLQSSGSIEDENLFQIIESNIMEAIKKTSELEGFSLIIDKTGNFIYGSDDINLTDKVLFRLDEKLMDLQNNEPLAPITLELKDESSAE